MLRVSRFFLGLFLAIMMVFALTPSLVSAAVTCTGATGATITCAEGQICKSGACAACTKDAECLGGNCDKGVCKTDFGTSQVKEGLGGTLGSTDLITTVTRIINVILGLLGIVSVIIVLVGGFEWMTAGGNEEKTATARKRIFAGIIGLAIILSAWAIARFVISRLSAATGSGDAASIEDL